MTNEQREKNEKLHGQGYSYATIADAVGLSRSSVSGDFLNRKKEYDGDNCEYSQPFTRKLLLGEAFGFIFYIFSAKTPKNLQWIVRKRFASSEWR